MMPLASAIAALITLYHGCLLTHALPLRLHLLLHHLHWEGGGPTRLGHFWSSAPGTLCVLTKLVLSEREKDKAGCCYPVPYLCNSVHGS